MLRKIISFIPNSITLLNLLSGTIAIVFALSPMERCGRLDGWQWASLMIGLAAIFDFMDGAAARLLDARSPIGKELDSLADLVSFGVAPALMMVGVMKLSPEAGYLAYAPLFIPLMGALRLAKFNIDESQATVFKGLPIPANAIFWIGTVSAICREEINPPVNLVILAVVVVSLLMVGNMKMFSLKFHNLSVKDNFLRYLIIISAVILVGIFGLSGLALTILFYIILSFLQNVVRITVS